jgi:hypothetical protein
VNFHSAKTRGAPAPSSVADTAVPSAVSKSKAVQTSVIPAERETTPAPAFSGKAATRQGVALPVFKTHPGR